MTAYNRAMDTKTPMPCSTSRRVILPLVWAVVASACGVGEETHSDPWPLACEQASFEISPDQSATCARREAGGDLLVRPDVLAAIIPGSGVQSLWVDGEWLFARDGKTVTALTFDNGPDYFREGLARIVDQGKIGFVDESLQAVIAPFWDFAFPFEGGVAVVCMGCRQVSDGEHVSMDGGGWGIIDHRGSVLVEPVHQRDALPADR